jgi:hypothetical protein
MQALVPGATLLAAGHPAAALQGRLVLSPTSALCAAGLQHTCCSCNTGPVPPAVCPSKRRTLSVEWLVLASPEKMIGLCCAQGCNRATVLMSHGNAHGPCLKQVAWLHQTVMRTGPPLKKPVTRR